MVSNLAELVHPMAEEEFEGRFRNGELFTVRASQPDKLASLLPWDTINDLCDGDCLHPERMSVMRDGLRMPEWLWYGNQPGRRVNAAALRGLLRQGATIVVNRIDELVPGIRRLTAAAQDRLQARVSANLYLSFRRGSALAAHYDHHDIIVAQIHGSKRWWFYGRREAFPVAIDPINCGEHPPPGDPVCEDVLNAGDITILPRGEWHRTAVEGDVSMHITMGVKPARGLNLIQRCLEEACKDVLFRQDIPHFRGLNALAAHEAQLKQRLTDIVARLSLEELVAEAAAPLPAPPPIPGRPPGSARRFHFPCLEEPS